MREGIHWRKGGEGGKSERCQVSILGKPKTRRSNIKLRINGTFEAKKGKFGGVSAAGEGGKRRLPTRDSKGGRETLIVTF